MNNGEKSSFPSTVLEPLPFHKNRSELILSKPRGTMRFTWFFPSAEPLQPIDGQLVHQPLLDFLNYNLRGVGQAIFANNPISGLLILIALFLQSSWVGIMSGVGVMASTLAAIALNSDRPSLRNGIFGYNGVLVGAALATFGASGNGTWNPCWIIATIVFSALTTLLMQTFGLWFIRKANCSPLTLPFVMTTLLFLAIAAWIPQPFYTTLVTSPSPLPPFEPINGWRVLASLPIGFGQVFLMDKFVSGLLVLAAVAWYSPTGAVVGILGGVCSTLTALMIGVCPDTLYAGLWSYNGVLTAMAISGIFFAPNLQNLLAGSFFAIVSTLLGNAFGNSFTLLRLPILTLPFCLATIAGFLLLQTRPSLGPWYRS
jgi:solute carrier family 14 (urea transporter)